MHASVFYINSCTVKRYAIVKLETIMQLGIHTYAELFVVNKCLFFQMNICCVVSELLAWISVVLSYTTRIFLGKPLKFTLFFLSLPRSAIRVLGTL
jgi:hypothetical protein